MVCWFDSENTLAIGGSKWGSHVGLRGGEGGGGEDMKDAVNRVAIKDISEKVNAPEWI